MKESKLNFSPDSSSKKDDFKILEFLSTLDEITKEKIENFRKIIISDDQRNLFDNSITESEKIILVAISRLSDDKLQELKKIASEGNSFYFPGIHDVNDKLAILFCLTQDTKYQD